MINNQKATKTEQQKLSKENVDVCPSTNDGLEDAKRKISLQGKERSKKENQSKLIFVLVGLKAKLHQKNLLAT